MVNNILDISKVNNGTFIACVIAVLCEQSPFTVSLQDVEKYWNGEIKRLQYDMIADAQGKGSITFSLKEKE